jgi:hypothetical protein
VTCSDGIAQPPQLVRRSTPNGRGCRVVIARAAAMLPARIQATSHTIRCRQRRKTSKASNSAGCNTTSVHQEPRCARPCQSASSPGACSPPSQRTTASLATVAVMAGPRSPRPNTASASPTSATAATNQPTPLVCRR